MLISLPIRVTILSKISNCSSIALLGWIRPAMKARTDWCSDLGSERSFRLRMMLVQNCLRVLYLVDMGQQTLHLRFLMPTNPASRSTLNHLEVIIYLQIQDLKKAKDRLNVVQTLSSKITHNQTLMEELFIKNILNLIQLSERKTCQAQT